MFVASLFLFVIRSTEASSQVSRSLSQLALRAVPSMAAVEVRGTGGMLSQAEEGMKLFAQAAGTAAEFDRAGAEKYKAEVETRIAALEAEAALLTGKDNKKERAAKGKEAAELKAEQCYVDACKIVKGLEPKFGYFVTKAAEVPEAPPPAEEEPKAEKAKKETKKESKKESAGLSPAETKELEDLKQQIVERKAILKEQGLSGGQQNKDEEIVKMVNRMNELKEKQDPGSSKKEKDAKKDSKKKTPLSAEEQKEYAQLQNEVEIYKAKLRTEFGYSNKEMKADPDLKDMEARLAALEKRS